MITQVLRVHETSAVMEQVTEWQSRPLVAIYPIVYLDCLIVKIRQDRRVIKKSIYLALGINIDGHKELLGMWISENEGAKFWLGVLTELSQRGVEDILIACVDCLKGFPDAINTAYPQTHAQLCIVHLVHNLPTEDFILELKKLNGTPKEVLENRDLMDCILPAIRADFKIADEYFFQGKANFSCPVSVLIGENDQGISLESVHSLVLKEH